MQLTSPLLLFGFTGLFVALAAAQDPGSGSIPLGGNCTNSVQCDGSNQYATTQCYQGVCGSVGAACTPDDGSNYWFADNICLFSKLDSALITSYIFCILSMTERLSP